MNTDTLMSSIREMVKAEVYCQLIQAGLLHATASSREAWATQYSRHETVVRTELQKLADLAAQPKEPAKLVTEARVTLDTTKLEELLTDLTKALGRPFGTRDPAIGSGIPSGGPNPPGY